MNSVTFYEPSEDCIYYCHLHRNSQLVVDEDDLKCVTNEKLLLLLI